MNYDYDVAVVGAGSGWLTVALGLAKQKRVVLIEWGPIGGDCTNFGCVPSKALIDIAKENPEIGFGKAMAEVRARRQVIQDEETVDKIESHWLKVIKWYASFVDEHTLKTEYIMQPLALKKSKDSGKNWESCEQKITAQKIILATWSSAVKIKIEWVADEDILTNHEIFEQTEDIRKLIVIWGWYIGCELAESIAALWVVVHLVQRNAKLIPREEAESSKLLQEIFEAKGIKVHTWSVAKYAKWKKLIITDIHGKNEEILEYDKILIALGRSANIEKLDLEKAEILSGKKWISVDSYNRTNKKHIFAIWDCVAWNPQFTHWANNEGRGVIRNILVPSILKKSVRNITLPAVLYTHLEVARVGKTHEELTDIYDTEELVTKTLYFENNDRSKVTQDTQGFIKIHFKRLSWKILWATIFWKNAWEMLGQMTIAMDHKVSAYKLASSIQAYPTKSDLIKRVCDRFVVGTVSNLRWEIKYFFKSNILQIGTAIIWISIMSFFLWYKSTTGLSLEEMALKLYNFIAWNPLWALIYILAYAIRPIILFPATLMTFMSWALFGFVWWFFLTWIGETMSAIFAYFLGGIFGKKLLSGEESWVIGQLKAKVNKDPFMAILSARFLFFPFDLTNYASWFLKVRFKSYVAATILWIIPGMSVFILAGAAFYNKELTSFSQALQDIDVTMLYFAAWLFILTLGFAKFLKKFKR